MTCNAIKEKKAACPIDQKMASADKSLTTEQKTNLEKLLRSHPNVFSSGAEDFERTSLIYHLFDTGDSEPLRQSMRRIPHEHIPVLKAAVEKLQKAGAVVPYTSPWASPTIIVKKRMVQ